MSISAVKRTFSISRWPLAFIGLAFAVFLLAWAPLFAQSPADNVTLEQTVTGAGSSFEPGARVGITLTAGFDASETLDADHFRVEVLGVQSYAFNVPLDPEEVNMRQAGASLMGEVTHSTGITGSSGSWESGTPTADEPYTIKFEGNITIPSNAMTGLYTVRTSLAHGTGTEQVIGSFRVEADEENDFAPTPVPPAPGGRSDVIRMEPNRFVDLPSSILSGLNSQVQAALGDGTVRLLGGTSPILSNDSGTLVLRLSALNMSSSHTINGDIDIDAPQITLETTNGAGTATLQLGPGIVLMGDVTLVPRVGGFDVVFSNARIQFMPEAPDVELLIGGSPDVSDLNSAYDLPITELPEGAALELVYAKDLAEFFLDPATVFGDVAEDMEGGVDDLSTDVAFTVEGITEGFAGGHLGDNTVTLLVNSSWHSDRDGEEKTLVIVKVDGTDVYAEEATCATASGGLTGCTAEFTGDAGAFSTYSLFAVGQPGDEPTPTATGPAPTSTPDGGETTPEPPDGGNLWIIILVVVVVMGVGGGAFFFLRRKPTGE